MQARASLKNSDSPQVIIENLARKRITEEEAEESLQRHWGRAYDTPTLIRLFREIFRNGRSSRRISR
jgi:hypothetical protein